MPPHQPRPVPVPLPPLTGKKSEPVAPAEEPAQRSRRGLAAGLVALGLVVAAAASAAAFGLFMQLDRLRHELSAMRKDVTVSKDRIARLERRIEGLGANAQAAREVPATPAVPDPNVRGALELSREEIQLLRDYIKVPPAAPGTAPTISLGSAVPPHVLMALPSQIGEKVPKLIGAYFMTDRNGAIVIVRRGSRKADAVIAPN